MHNFPRTQNSIEAWHQRCQYFIDSHNVSLFKITREIQKEQAIVENTLEQLSLSERPLKKKKKGRIEEERIQRIIENRHT